MNRYEILKLEEKLDYKPCDILNEGVRITELCASALRGIRIDSLARRIFSSSTVSANRLGILTTIDSSGLIFYSGLENICCPTLQINSNPMITMECIRDRRYGLFNRAAILVQREISDIENYFFMKLINNSIETTLSIYPHPDIEEFLNIFELFKNNGLSVNNICMSVHDYNYLRGTCPHLRSSVVETSNLLDLNLLGAPIQVNRIIETGNIYFFPQPQNAGVFSIISDIDSMFFQSPDSGNFHISAYEEVSMCCNIKNVVRMSLRRN